MLVRKVKYDKELFPNFFVLNFLNFPIIWGSSILLLCSKVIKYIFLFSKLFTILYDFW